METESVIAFLVGVVSILSGCIGVITFFVLKRRIWIESQVPGKIEAKEITLEKTQNININLGNVYNYYFFKDTDKLNATEEKERVGPKVEVTSLVTGRLIVIKSKYGDLIDQVTRLDVYHPAKLQENVDSFVEKAADLFGFDLIKEEETQKLKGQVNG